MLWWGSTGSKRIFSVPMWKIWVVQTVKPLQGNLRANWPGKPNTEQVGIQFGNFVISLRGVGGSAASLLEPERLTAIYSIPKTIELLDFKFWS